MNYIIRDPQKTEYVKQELTHIVSEALAGFKNCYWLEYVM